MFEVSCFAILCSALLTIYFFAGSTSSALRDASHQTFLFLAHSEFVFEHLAFEGKVSSLPGPLFLSLGTVDGSLELTRLV